MCDDCESQNRIVTCNYCNGWGRVEGEEKDTEETCRNCGGTGEVRE
jgi:DnaJ-class molecular chaperone